MLRREFLKMSAGSLTLSVCFSSLTIARFSADNPSALVSANGVLTINPDGHVRFVSPYTEMGQGSPTAAAQIIADALHTDLEQMEIVHPEGTAAHKDEAYRDLFNGGGSGGSQSMATAWPALLEIGATARTLLMEAAAVSWGIDAARCSTETDRVVADGRSLPYNELCGAAAELPLPEKLRHRPVREFSYVGKGRRRRDLPQILTGEAAYAMDARLDNMVFAGLERCPSCGGKPAIRNRAEVLALPGIVDVFAMDTSESNRIAKPAVVVIGEDTWAVTRGRRALDIEWRRSEGSYNDEEAFWAAMSRQLENGEPNAVETTGDFENVPLDSLTTVSGEYRTPHQNQAIMEPMTMVAHRSDDGLQIILSTQYPGDVRGRIADLTGLEQSQISIENRIMGGSFGRRYMPDCLTETVLVADKLRRPVKLMWTREDDTRHGQYRNASFTRIDAAVDEAGDIQRWYHRSVQTDPRDPSKVTRMEDGMNDQPFAFPAARFEMHGIKGDVNLGPMRSPPHPLKHFAVTSFIDEIAHRYDRDPIDLHIELIGKPRALPVSDWLGGHGHSNETAKHVDVMNMVRKLSDWDTPLPAGHGRGFSAGFIFGTYIAMVITVAERNGLLHIEQADCAIDCGRVINPDIARQQVEGGLIYGLSSAVGEAITTAGGGVVQGNFDTYPLLRFAQAPTVNVLFAENDDRPSGLGEPPTPPAYAALGNAIFAATGKRIREIPFSRHIRFA